MLLQGDHRYVSLDEVQQLAQGSTPNAARADDAARAGSAAARADGEAAATAAASVGGVGAKGELQLGRERWLEALAPGGAFGDSLRARQLLVVEGEGQCRTLFVHAGMSA
jgi:hypothetical protein